MLPVQVFKPEPTSAQQQSSSTSLAISVCASQSEQEEHSSSPLDPDWQASCQEYTWIYALYQQFLKLLGSPIRLIQSPFQAFHCKHYKHGSASWITRRNSLKPTIDFPHSTRTFSTVDTVLQNSCYISGERQKNGQHHQVLPSRGVLCQCEISKGSVPGSSVHKVGPSLHSRLEQWSC